MPNFVTRGATPTGPLSVRGGAQENSPFTPKTSTGRRTPTKKIITRATARARGLHRAGPARSLQFELQGYHAG